MFPVAAPVLVVWLVTKTLMYTSAEFGYLESGENDMLIAFGSVLFGLLAGLLVRKFLWVGVGFMGIAAGWTAGTVSFGLALSTFEDSEML